VWSRDVRPATILFDSEPGGLFLVIGGDVEGTALSKFAGAMELVLMNHSSQFIVDVSDVDEWSLIAQAMVLTTARRKAGRGEQLVLRGASPALRERSQQLGVFEHIRSIDSHPARPSWGTNGAAGGTGAHAARPVGGDR